MVCTTLKVTILLGDEVLNLISSSIKKTLEFSRNGAIDLVAVTNVVTVTRSRAPFRECQLVCATLKVTI